MRDAVNLHVKLERPKRIWVVDDDESYLDRFCKLLESSIPDLEVEQFETGEAILNAIKAAPSSEYPDLLFVDVHLPKMSGVDVLVKLDMQGYRVPSVLMSQHDRGSTIRSAGRTRASAFLVKPATFDENWLTLILANINFALSRSADRTRFERDEVTAKLKTFYQAINHDYRQPIVQSRLTLQELGEKLERLGHGKRTIIGRYVKAIDKQLRQAADVIEDVKAITEDGTVRLFPENINLTKLTRSLESTWKSQFRSFQVLKERGLTSVQVDKNKLKRSLNNLVANAFKYSNNPETAECLVEFASCADVPGFWCVTVRDNGRGIPPQNLSMIGWPGVRGDNASDVEGSGKGLAMVKRYCELHSCILSNENGRFSVKNREDVPSGVEVSLMFPKSARELEETAQ